MSYHSVSIFHHNKPSISRESAKSELAASWNIISSATAVKPVGDKRKVRLGIRQKRCYCDRCLLGIFDTLTDFY